MKKVCVIGCFAEGVDLSNGQTVKTKIVYQELARTYGYDMLMSLDTYGGMKTLIKSPQIVIKALKNAENVVILPAENGLRVFAPLLVIFNVFFRKKIFYDVIGGWLPTFIENRHLLKRLLKRLVLASGEFSHPESG